jgi:GH35 family endo-1,4-beta-xylanase
LFTAPQPHLLDPTYAHRQATAQVTVICPDGAALANNNIIVEQVRHKFLFGNIGFDMVAMANDYADGATVSADEGPQGGPTEEELDYDKKFARHWLRLFNMATLPFYWGRFEPEEGKPRTQELLNTAKWFTSRGVTVKGHPLMWHTVQPQWLLGKPLDEVERLQRARIRREVGDFEGTIDMWDAINEAVIMPVFDNGDNAITPLAWAKGRVDTIRLAFEEARAVNPSVKLLLNDFDMSTAYECLIEAVLEAGITIDVLGLQSHQHQGYWGLEKTQRVLDRFGRYNIPIHFTETTMLSGDIMPKHIVDLNDWQVDEWPSSPDGEERQADELEEWYRTLVSHPLVEAITLWGLSDRGMWLGAPGGLIRADGTLKPAYHRLHHLIKTEWWYDVQKISTDAEGRIDITGWKGDYRISCTGAPGTTPCAEFTLDGDGPLTVELTR